MSVRSEVIEGGFAGAVVVGENRSVPVRAEILPSPPRNSRYRHLSYSTSSEVSYCRPSEKSSALQQRGRMNRLLADSSDYGQG